jgi:hypothetical protein
VCSTTFSAILPAAFFAADLLMSSPLRKRP